jgi:hypothetical protein
LFTIAEEQFPKGNKSKYSVDDKCCCGVTVPLLSQACPNAG